jgi:hypothetical protein
LSRALKGHVVLAYNVLRLLLSSVVLIGTASCVAVEVPVRLRFTYSAIRSSTRVRELALLTAILLVLPGIAEAQDEVSVEGTPQTSQNSVDATSSMDLTSDTPTAASSDSATSGPIASESRADTLSVEPVLGLSPRQLLGIMVFAQTIILALMAWKLHTKSNVGSRTWRIPARQYATNDRTFQATPIAAGARDSMYGMASSENSSGGLGDEPLANGQSDRSINIARVAGPRRGGKSLLHSRAFSSRRRPHHRGCVASVYSPEVRRCLRQAYRRPSLEHSSRMNKQRSRGIKIPIAVSQRIQKETAQSNRSASASRSADNRSALEVHENATCQVVNPDVSLHSLSQELLLSQMPEQAATLEEEPSADGAAKEQEKRPHHRITQQNQEGAPLDPSEASQHAVVKRVKPVAPIVAGAGVIVVSIWLLRRIT